MLLKEAMNTTKLSKKAIQYYEDEGFIHPIRLENGYREYDETCIQTLLYIHDLRRLGLNIEKIRKILLNDMYAPQLYEERIHEIDEETNVLHKQKAILLKLMKDKDVDKLDYADLTKGQPYLYTRNAGVLSVIFFLLSFLCVLVLYPYIPNGENGSVLYLTGFGIVVFVRHITFTKGVWESRHQEISLKHILLFLLILLLESFFFVGMFKASNALGTLNSYAFMLNRISFILCFCLLVYDSYHILRFDGLIEQEDVVEGNAIKDLISWTKSKLVLGKKWKRNKK